MVLRGMLTTAWLSGVKVGVWDPRLGGLCSAENDGWFGSGVSGIGFRVIFF